jgi:hypothetical protein
MEFIQKLMRLNYFHEQSPAKKVKILSEIETIQVFISRYFEETRWPKASSLIHLVEI